MKRLLYLVLIVLLYTACDKVTDPIVKNDKVVGSNFIEKNNFLESDSKKTLLEDYTGQTCPNCPDAAETATALSQQYGKSLVVIAVHAGSFASPIGTFTNDFRTTAGNAWLSTFNIVAFPSGMVNRKVYPGSSSVLLLRTKWAGAIAQATTEPFVVKLDLNTKYDPEVRALNAEIKATFKTNFDKNISLISLLIEDSIVGQQDYHGVEIEDYEFEHVVLGTVPDAEIWGKRLKTAPIVSQTDTIMSFEGFPLMSEDKKGRKINDKKVSLVIIAFNENTREVLQVEKVKIR